MKCLKKLLGIAVSAVMLVSAMCFTNTASVSAAEIIPVYLNGKLLEFPANDAQPQIYQNRTYVPIRVTAEYLGLTINWNSKTETMTFSRDGITIDHTMRSNIVYVSGKALTFDTRSINVQNRTLMPIRMLGESIGATVDWDNAKRCVYITTADKAGSESTETTTSSAVTTTTASGVPRIVSVNSNKANAAPGEKVKISIEAQNATRVKVMDSEDGSEIEVISEYGESSGGSRIFETLLEAKNSSDEPIIKGVIVAAGDDNKFYEDIQDTKTLNYIVSESGSKKDDDDDDDDKDDEKIKSDYLISYKLDDDSYDEDDYATLTVVTTDEVEKVKITNNYNSGRAEGSEYTEKNGERTFKIKNRMSKKGKIYLYITLYIEDEGYEAVSQKVPVTVGTDEDSKTYDDLEIVDIELLNETVYDGEEAHILVYTSTDVKEVSIYDPDDRKVASSYYNSGRKDGQLVWELSFEVDHTGREKYTVYAYDDDDNDTLETIKIEGESYSKNDNVILSVEQKTSNVKDGDTCKFSVKTTSGIEKIVLATDSGKTIETASKGAKSGSYRTFTIKGEIDDIEDDYQIFGYDEDDNKEDTYKFRIKGTPTDEVEIISVDVEDNRVDIDDRIELTVETSKNVEKITIVDQDDYRVYKETEPSDEDSSSYIWDISFYARDEGKNTFTITAEDDDDNTDEWDFNVTVDD